MLTIEPGRGPDYCPSCERTFTAQEQRELWERTIHGWPTSPFGSPSWALIYND